jgi:hypothetical protein
MLLRNLVACLPWLTTLGFLEVRTSSIFLRKNIGISWTSMPRIHCFTHKYSMEMIENGREDLIVNAASISGVTGRGTGVHYCAVPRKVL